MPWRDMRAKDCGFARRPVPQATLPAPRSGRAATDNVARIRWYCRSPWREETAERPQAPPREVSAASSRLHLFRLAALNGCGGRGRRPESEPLPRRLEIEVATGDRTELEGLRQQGDVQAHAHRR